MTLLPPRRVRGGMERQQGEPQTTTQYKPMKKPISRKNEIGTNAIEQDISMLIPAHALASWEQLQRECAERDANRRIAIDAARARGINADILCY